MQSGRIAPVFKQFFTAALSSKGSTDSHSQQNGQQRGQPEREPTPEEASEALAVLTRQEEFQKNLLNAELKQVDGRFAIYVCNAQGIQLKVIRGSEILRLLEGVPFGGKGPHLGRILDRRV